MDFSKIDNQVSDIIHDIPLIKKRRRKKMLFSFLKWLLLIVLLIFISGIIFIGANFLTFKKIYNASLSGKNNLEQSLAFFKVQAFNQAAASANSATIDFGQAFTEIDSFKDSLAFKLIPALGKHLDNALYLLATGDFASRAIAQGIMLGQEFEDLLSEENKITYSKFSQEEKGRILQKLYESTPELNGIKANLELSLINLKKVENDFLFSPLKADLALASDRLELALNLLETMVPISQILPEIAGYPSPSSFLVILQNNDELRPTGGFIGTYGILDIKNGDINNFATHDVYHLDMPIQDKLDVLPPEPLVKYLGVDNWYLRDANWSPDWPRSAEQVLWFFNKESELAGSEKKDFNGVVALTPDLIIDLLRFTGPIVIDDIEFNADNFQELLQYEVEQGYQKLGVPKWQRKEIIGDIARELKIRLFDTQPDKWNELFDIVRKNISQKNLILYLKDQNLEKIVKEQGWGGEIKDSASDYLMVVDANMAAFKTDAVVDKSISYKISQQADGWRADLTINYSHRGGFDWRTTRYRSYTRVYVPLGSQLIAATGLSDSAAQVYNEFGKICFAGFISIEPGEIGHLHFSYKLPPNLANDSQYGLYLQKQPGNKINQLTVDLGFLNKVKSYSPATLSSRVISADRISWETDLATDKLFIVNF